MLRADGMAGWSPPVVQGSLLLVPGERHAGSRALYDRGHLAAWETSCRNARRESSLNGIPASVGAKALLVSCSALTGLTSRRRRHKFQGTTLHAGRCRYSGVFRLRGQQSRKYLSASHAGDLSHDDHPSEQHLFTFVPGIGAQTGSVKLHHLYTNKCIFLTGDGVLGTYHGNFVDQYWKVVCDGDRFLLENIRCNFRLFSSADGRLGWYDGEVFDDQYFLCEDEEGHIVSPTDQGGCFGLQDSGFRWLGGIETSTVYTDSFHASHYVYDKYSGQLCELREQPDVWQASDWGAASDMHLPDMNEPHRWAIENIPFLQQLAHKGFIDVTSQRNAIYPSTDFRDNFFTGQGLPPSGAISFAVGPVSDAQNVPFREDWLRAWHGTSLHAIESIAQDGLTCNEKNKIYLSPSFQYTFCLYSLPDLFVGPARFRIVVEVRVRPDSYVEHGDLYQFCDTRQIEHCVPPDRLEWDVEGEAGAVQVVSLVLKQLRPDHPTLRHETNIRHASEALMRL